MKKIISLVLATVLLLGTVFALASCSNVSEKYANKINDAAKDKKNLTYEEVMDDLGDEAIDMTFANHNGGWIVAVKGVTSEEDLQEKIENDEEIEGIVVTIVAGKAISAKYGKIDENSFEY